MSNGTQILVCNDDSEDSIKIHESSWEVIGDHYVPRSKSTPTLDPGSYLAENIDPFGYVLTKMKVSTDNLLDLKDSITTEVIQNVTDFWNNRKLYHANGFSWKRGLFLWGVPGGGKTSCINRVIKSTIDVGGVCIYVKSPWHSIKCVEAFRNVEPDRKLLVVMEDIDAMIKNYDENDVLSLLDGQYSTNNVIYVATTNYPEKLDRRIINRPSRFDMVREIGCPSADGRKIYLTAKCSKFFDGKNEEELSSWVSKTDKYTVSHLKELILLTQCYGRSLDDAVASLTKMMEEQPSSDDYAKQRSFMGFN